MKKTKKVHPKMQGLLEDYRNWVVYILESQRDEFGDKMPEKEGDIFWDKLNDLASNYRDKKSTSKELEQILFFFWVKFYHEAEDKPKVYHDISCDCYDCRTGVAKKAKD